MYGRSRTTTAFEVSPALPPQQVVLEVDRSRQAEYWRWLVIGLVVLAAALFDGWQRSVPVSNGYRLEEIRRAMTEEDAVGRRLRLEVAALSSPARVEWLATNRLHLVAPGRGDAVVIERVVPPPAPPSSVVAAR